MKYLPPSLMPSPIVHDLTQRESFSVAQTLLFYSRLSDTFSSLYSNAHLAQIQGFLTTGGSISFTSLEAFTHVARVYDRDEVLSFSARWTLDEKVHALLETPEERPQKNLKRTLHLVGENRLRIMVSVSAALGEAEYKTYCSLKECVETFK